MEGLVSAELKKMGLKEVSAENGGVFFDAAAGDLFRCNLLMRFSDRIYIVMSAAVCKSFSELFDLVYAIDWQNYASGNESFNVSAKCSRSRLMSPRDCQSITKKAIIEKMKNRTGRTRFPEDGSALPVLVSVRNDEVRILLNTSGDALSRRGYRTWNGEAPLRETLASAMVELSPWRPGLPLHDPCCGTGTLLIEAAFKAAGRAPGLNRPFAMESLYCFQDVPFHAIRESLRSNVDPAAIRDISGSDADPEALKLAVKHLRQAGLGERSVPLACCPLQSLTMDTQHGVFLCNPPYGERLSDQKNCRLLYHDLHLLKNRHPTWSLCAISSDPAFERSFGKRADKKRRLYNGRLECVFYIYH